jgi:hypothetical protein
MRLVAYTNPSNGVERIREMMRAGCTRIRPGMRFVETRPPVAEAAGRDVQMELQRL